MISDRCYHSKKIYKTHSYYLKTLSTFGLTTCCVLFFWFCFFFPFALTPPALALSTKSLPVTSMEAKYADPKTVFAWDILGLLTVAFVNRW